MWVQHITKHSRGIHNAWQFWFELALVFTAQWFRLGGGVVHPLMRRYKPVVSSTGFKHIKLGLRGRFRTQPLSFHELVIVSTLHSHRTERIPLR
ncbi:hypothetical protein CGJ90_22390 [Vibrio parahaemolyticus]|nr:hypothetical protein CGJ90_22390 [Vibrio parahaemolyticus]